MAVLEVHSGGDETAAGVDWRNGDGDFGCWEDC